MKYFNQKLIGIVTKHSKEFVIKPHLESLGLKVHVLNEIDTDLLGTFTGEIPRELSAFENAKSKCLLAPNSFPFVMASEGSFQSHPLFEDLMVNEEYLVLYDRENHHFFRARKVFAKSNFKQAKITGINEFEDFLTEIGFPHHGVILGEDGDFVKDIQSKSKWIEFFHNEMTNSDKQQVFVQTDMRACNNPTRMKNIGELMLEFLASLKNQCPSCEAPQLELVKVQEGLSCSWCQLPTKSAQAKLWKCWKCHHEVWEEITELENPGLCQWCNP